MNSHSHRILGFRETAQLIITIKRIAFVKKDVGHNNITITNFLNISMTLKHSFASSSNGINASSNSF